MRTHIGRRLLQRAVQRRFVAAVAHSIRAMPGTHARRARARARLLPLVALSGSLLALLVPAQAGARGPSVTAALQACKSSGAITEAAYKQYAGAYVGREQLAAAASAAPAAPSSAAVIANVQAMAAAGQFTPSRLPVIFLTLEKQPPVVDDRTAARSRRARELSAAASSCGSTTPGRASRSSGWGPSARPTATTSRATKTRNLRQLLCRSAAAGHQARRGHRLGVHVPLRRRLARRGRAGCRRAPRCRCSRARGRASRNRPT